MRVLNYNILNKIALISINYYSYDREFSPFCYLSKFYKNANDFIDTNRFIGVCKFYNLISQFVISSKPINSKKNYNEVNLESNLLETYTTNFTNSHINFFTCNNSYNISSDLRGNNVLNLNYKYLVCNASNTGTIAFQVEIKCGLNKIATKSFSNISATIQLNSFKIKRKNSLNHKH